MSENEKKRKTKYQSAKEVAEIMAANMAANMEDPEFLDKQERIRDKVRAKIIKERRLREQKKTSESE